MTNKNHTTLYTGMTSELPARTLKHKTKFYENSFSARYNLDKLVYFEVHDRITDAIAREKQIKGGSRKKKIQLINKMNPEWKDLYDDLVGVP